MVRVTIEKGYQPAVHDLMQKLGVDDPKLAVNHIINSWLLGQQAASPATEPPLSPPPVDEFSEIVDWG